MDIRITVSIDGDTDDMVEVNATHDAAPNAKYCYGGCAFKDVPAIVEGALEDIVKEILEIQELPEGEVAERKVHEMWMARQLREMTDEQRAAHERYLAECAASAEAHKEAKEE